MDLSPGRPQLRFSKYRNRDTETDVSLFQAIGNDMKLPIAVYTSADWLKIEAVNT
jgi:hypothetical protein